MSRRSVSIAINGTSIEAGSGRHGSVGADWEGGDAVLTWVPTQQVAEAVAGLAGVQAEIVNLDQAAVDGDTTLPASAAKVQFCVLPFFPQEPALSALAALP